MLIIQPGEPGLSHLLVVVRVFKSRKSDARREHRSTFPGVFLTKASYMVKLRFKGYNMDSIFCWEEWHSHVAKGHPCLWLREKSVGSGEMKEEV